MSRRYFQRLQFLWLRRRKGRGQICFSLLLGFIMAILLIRWFDTTLRPQLVALSETQIRNHLTMEANNAVVQCLEQLELTYNDFVKLQAADGLSTLTADTAALNRLRACVIEAVVRKVDSLEGNSLGVPLGALTGIDLLSALGPKLPVRVISVASADGQYRNDFTGAGINQTLHRIMLDITLNAKLLLPGGVVDVAISTPVCVAETVIIGQVPQTYLQWSP